MSALMLQRTREGRDVDVKTQFVSQWKFKAKSNKAENGMKITNLEQTGFCNKSNKYDTIATCVNNRYMKLTNLFF